MLKAKLKLSCYVLSQLVLFGLLGACSVLDKFFGEDEASSPTGNGDAILQFVAMGDTGSGSEDQYKVARAVKDKCANDGCDMVLLLGDNIYPDGVSSVDDPQLQSKFEKPYAEIEQPFYLALGNHDYGKNGAGYDVEKSMHQVSYSEKSKKWNMPQRFYKFSSQNASFFALDTNAQMFGKDQSQREKLTDWLANDKSQWKIAFGHHPYFSNGPHGNAGTYEGTSELPIVSGKTVKQFADAVWCGKVDLYLSGHDHSRQWLEPTCSGTQLAVSGAGAKTTTLSGSNPVKFQSASLGFLYVSITGNILNAEFVNAEGQTEFRHRIEK